jgi:hypothetical protein
MATATKTGLSRKAYNEAIEADRKARNVKEYEKMVDDYTNRRDSLSVVARDLRELHIKHLGTTGADYVSSVLSNIEYELSSAVQNVKRYTQKLDALQGNATVEDDDDF